MQQRDTRYYIDTKHTSVIPETTGILNSPETPDTPEILNIPETPETTGIYEHTRDNRHTRNTVHTRDTPETTKII